MADSLTDRQIAELLEEPKALPSDFRKKLVLKPKRGHEEVELSIVGNNNSDFKILVRRSMRNRLDFSVILTYTIPGSNKVLRLKRYNGKSHEHSNPLEKERFYDYHVHTATERYQQTGSREDTFAEVTNRYATVDQALRCLFEDCSFELPSEAQQELF